MALDSSLVRVAVTGAVYVSLDGSGSVPTDATTTPDAGFDDLGYVTDAGVVQSMSQNINDIVAWQNGDVVRKVQTSHDLTYALSLLETNPNALQAYFGEQDDSTAIEITGDVLPRLKWIIDVIDGDERVRLVIPEGQVTERGDVSYVNGDAVSYPLTITAFPDTDGVKAYMYRSSVVSS